MPFTFKEFLLLNKALNVEEAFYDYLQWGGFPLVFTLNNNTSKEIVLKSLYDSIVLRDIIIKENISSSYQLSKIVDYLTSSSSKTLSSKNIKNYLDN